MGIVKFILSILLYALAATINFFLFALIFAFTIPSASGVTSVVTVIGSFIAFLFLTIRKYRLVFPAKKNVTAPKSEFIAEKSTDETASELPTTDDHAAGLFEQEPQPLPIPDEDEPPPYVPDEDEPPPFIRPINTMYCRHCGMIIDQECIVCPKCFKQVNELKVSTPNVVINPAPVRSGKEKDKWVAFVLCLFLGVYGVHRFYEGKIGTGLLYLFTGGLFTFGALVDLIAILCKPNPYYV